MVNWFFHAGIVCQACIFSSLVPLAHSSPIVQFAPVAEKRVDRFFDLFPRLCFLQLTRNIGEFTDFVLLPGWNMRKTMEKAAAGKVSAADQYKTLFVETSERRKSGHSRTGKQMQMKRIAVKAK